MIWIGFADSIMRGKSHIVKDMVVSSSAAAAAVGWRRQGWDDGGGWTPHWLCRFLS